MLINIIEHIKRNDPLSVPHKGKVVFVEDELKIKRVKVRIKDLLEEGDIEKLPWVYPANPYGLGGRPDSSGTSIPEMGSELTIVFPFKDVYFPFYTGYWQSALTKQEALFDDSYPEMYGWVDKQCQWLRVDKEVGWNEFFRETFSDLVRMDEEGNWWINVPKNLIVQVGEDFKLQVKQDYKQQIDRDKDTRIKRDQRTKIDFDNTTEVGQENNLQVGLNYNIHVLDKYHVVTEGMVIERFYDEVDREYYDNVVEMMRANRYLTVKDTYAVLAEGPYYVETLDAHVQKVGATKSISVMGDSEYVVGGAFGLNAETYLTLNAPYMFRNVGVLVECEPPDIAALEAKQEVHAKEQEDNIYIHQPNNEEQQAEIPIEMVNNTTSILELDERIVELEIKLESLKELAVQIHARTDAVLPDIAKVD